MDEINRKDVKNVQLNRDGSELQPRSLSEKDAYGGNCLNDEK